MPCHTKDILWAVCGHTSGELTHRWECYFSEHSEYRPDLLLEECWSPYSIVEEIPKYRLSACGSFDCQDNQLWPEQLEAVRQEYRPKIADYEAKHRFAVRRKNSPDWKEHKKAFRAEEFRKKVAKMTADLLKDGVKLHVIDLTLPREEILKDYLIPIVAPPPDKECLFCSTSLLDATIGPDGEDLDDALPGQGIVRQVGCPNKDMFHAECIIKYLVLTHRKCEPKGDRCPECLNALDVRFVVFNGVEKTQKRYVPSDGTLPGLHAAVGGYLTLEETASHRRADYMRIIPFRPAPVHDRWGYLPDGNFDSRLELPI